MHLERRLDGVPGMLGVVDRGPEEGEDPVADEVAHHSAMGEDAVHHRREVLVHRLGHLRGGEPLAQRREPAEVGHEDGDLAHLTPKV